MNKFRFSSKMHLFIIITCVLVAVGLAVGLVCQFTAGGFFNWGGNYASYKAVRVQYDIQLSLDEVQQISDKAFDDAGVDYYTFVTADNSSAGHEIEYRFATSEDTAALKTAASAINSQVGMEGGESGYLGSAYYSEYETILGGSDDIMYAGIALAAAVVFQFLYFFIRYKLTMAIAAFIGDIHNLALFYALLAITRVQVSLSVVALSVFVVLATMIGCAVFFDKMRKGAKKDDFKAMPSFDQVDTAARESFPLVTVLYGILAVAAVIMLVLTTVGSFSIFSLFMICATALIAAVVGEYGTMFFVPSIYSRLKLRADNYAAAKAVKYQGAKKAEKAE